MELQGEELKRIRDYGLNICFPALIIVPIRQRILENEMNRFKKVENLNHSYKMSIVYFLYENKSIYKGDDK